MSPCCELDLEDSKQFFFPAWHSGAWCCINIPSLITSAVQRIFTGQTFTDILNHHCDLDFAVIQFFHRTLWLMMLYYPTKFGCKYTSSLGEIAEIVIFWLYMPLLWPWHWRQWTNFSAWHSGSWCCMTMPSLITKWSAVQKISGQTFTDILNLCCDLDMECSNPIFPKNTSAYDAVLSN